MTVTLTDPIFAGSFNVGKNMLLRLDEDRLLAPFYEAMGQKAKKKRYGGWEAKGISGHTLGHYLSALSFAYLSDGDERVKAKAIYCIDELYMLQGENGYICGFPEADSFSKVFDNPDTFTSAGFELAGWWVPFYTLHKVLRGILDVYENISYDKALSLAKGLGLWVYKGCSKLNEDARLRLLKCEYGGMNEALVKLYHFTEDKRFYDTALFFCEEGLLDPLSENTDKLSNLHANTQIPKVIGAVEVYNNGADSKMYNAAENFWSFVANDRSYAIGGHGIAEHFEELGKESLATNTCETCNSNNMIRLSKMLWDIKHDSKYYDYIEKMMFNHILPSQDERGMKTYFVGLMPGNFKVYSSEEESFWCCFGSGLENPFTYDKHIYALDDSVYVNLYISSRIYSDIIQAELIRSDDKAVFTFLNDYKGSIYFRRPGWCDNFKIISKGEIFEPGSGYVSVCAEFNADDTIEISLEKEIIVHHKKDDSSYLFYTYGETVLAERIECGEKMEDHAKGENDLTNQEVPSFDVINNPQISVGENKAISLNGHILIPFYEIVHGRYRIYFKTN